MTHSISSNHVGSTTEGFKYRNCQEMGLNGYGISSDSFKINQSAAPEFGPTLVQTVVPDPRQVHRRSLLSVLCVSYRSNLIHYQGQMWSPATTPRVRNA